MSQLPEDREAALAALKNGGEAPEADASPSGGSMPEVVELETPIEYGKQTIEVLNFRTIRGGDVADFPLQGGKMRDLLKIAGKLCGQPDIVIMKLEGKDLARVVAAMGNSMKALQSLASSEDA
jgi:hypothetical protein